MLCVSAMSCLLEKNRHQRIGAAGFASFATHPFFEKIDFAALERKEIPPVFVPARDKANFDATYDLEVREDELHRMIETLFEPFDYTAVSYQGYVLYLMSPRPLR